MTNVLIIDDYDLVRRGLKTILDELPGMKVVGEAKTSDDALRLAREHNPHLVLLDVRIPGIGGLDILRKLLRLNAEMRVLALAPAEDEMLVAHALQAGASGFIAKQAKSEEIMRAIRAVNAGQRYLNTDMAQKLAWKRMRSAPESPFDVLSTRELQITKMIMSGQKVPAIAVKLCLSSKTVNGYRYRIFRKLNIATDVELALLAMRHGILQAQDDTVE